MQGEVILAIIILIVLFYSEWKSRKLFVETSEEIAKNQEIRAFYERLPTMSREELEEIRGEDDE